MAIAKKTPVFCQYCGKKMLEKLPKETGYKCLNCDRITFLNSSPAVCAVIIKNNKVLLVRDLKSSLWDLPGGFLLFGEDPEVGLKRELKEELNVDVEVKKLVDALIDVYEDESDYTLNLFYETELLSDIIKPDSEIIDYKWFDLANLSSLKYQSISKFFFKNKII